MLPVAGVTDRSPPPSAAERTRNHAFGSDVSAWHELRRLLEHSVDHGRVEDLPRGAAETRRQSARQLLIPTDCGAADPRFRRGIRFVIRVGIEYFGGQFAEPPRLLIRDA